MRRLVVVGCLMLAAGFSGCSSGSGTAHGDTITLYNGQHEQTTDALVKAFEQQTGITVKVRSADEDSLASQIDQEGSSSPADVFYTENSPPLFALDSKGLLATVEPGTLAAIPKADNAPDGTWVGVSARVSAMVYDTHDLTPGQLPTSILDLAARAWKGKLGIAPTETDFQPIVASIAHFEGQQAALAWLKGIQANAGDRNYPDNETLVNNVNEGHAQLAVINEYYWFRLRQELGASAMHSAIAEFAPRDPGYIIDVSGAAVLRSSKHQADAQRLLAFLVSDQGEGILAHSYSYEYPLASGVAANGELPAFATFQPAALPLVDIGDGSSALALLQQAQLA